MKRFNVTGSCDPQIHYMVDITGRLREIKELVDNGDYFTINRARQYGKTTTLKALEEFLKDDYVVISLDFQRIGNAKFATEHTFSLAFVNYLKRVVVNKRDPLIGLDNSIIDEMRMSVQKNEWFAFDDLFPMLSELCETADRPVVLIIDEVDSATNNQVFLDFLAQLRSYYLDRKSSPTFQSVILAGVYDVKNIKRKLRPNEEHKVNSPWNVATDFTVDMSFSEQEIWGMLADYEADYHTGMDTDLIAGLIFDYTSGYPFLVSKYCKLIDEKVAGSEGYPDGKAAWTRQGFLEADKMLLSENNTLFESLFGKLRDYPELDEILRAILLSGRKLTYNPDMGACQLGTMFGFIKNKEGTIEITNRVFETRLYNYYLSEKQLTDALYLAASRDKEQFFKKDGALDMDMVLRKFVSHYQEIYGDNDQKFIERYGRMFFLLYLRPLINGVGNYYIEAQTRDAKRTDLIVDYRGQQFVVKMKIWGGAKYHREGEDQLVGYLERYHLDRGYLLTFSFLKEKKTGVKEVDYRGKVLVEAIV